MACLQYVIYQYNHRIPYTRENNKLKMIDLKLFSLVLAPITLA